MATNGFKDFRNYCLYAEFESLDERLEKEEDWLNYHLPFYFEIVDHNFDDVLNWVENNVKGKFIGFSVVFFFELEEDAFLFKMVWG